MCSQAEFILSSEDGRVICTMYIGELTAEERSFTVLLEGVAAANYHAVTLADQGQSTASFIKRWWRPAYNLPHLSSVLPQ